MPSTSTSRSCELETDKVTVEVPAPASGVLASIAVNEGDTVEVGAVIASLNEGEGASSWLRPRHRRAAAPQQVHRSHRRHLHSSKRH